MRTLLENILPKKESIVDLEVIIKFPAIGLRKMLINARQIKNEKTAEHLILLAIEDVTEKNLAEEQIRSSEEKFKSIFDNSLAAVLVADDNGNYLSANKAATDLFGYTYNEFMLMNVGSLKTNILSEAANRFEEYARKGEEKGEFDFGILICGSANGVAMTANKHQGIRAGIAWAKELAMLTRQHNNANILCLPARFISLAVAKECVIAFIETAFEGGRHQNRVDKIAC